mgnify:FL=1
MDFLAFEERIQGALPVGKPLVEYFQAGTVRTVGLYAINSHNMEGMGLDVLWCFRLRLTVPARLNDAVRRSESL